MPFSGILITPWGRVGFAAVTGTVPAWPSGPPKLIDNECLVPSVSRCGDVTLYKYIFVVKKCIQTSRNVHLSVSSFFEGALWNCLAPPSDFAHPTEIGIGSHCPGPWGKIPPSNTIEGSPELCPVEHK